MSENFKFFFDIGVVLVVGWFAWKLRNKFKHLKNQIKNMSTISNRPKNGCARCTWWRYYQSGWGRCRVFKGTKTWYQHAPCSEYEFDPSIPDTIIID